MTISPNDDPPPANPPQSEGLFCPNCEYDLTGLTEPRCPECGEPFDNEELIHWGRLQQQTDAPLLIDGTTGPPAILRIFRDSLFHPVRLARQISPAAGIDMATGYSLATRVVAGAILFLFGAMAVGPSPGDIGIAVLVMPMMVCGVSVGCEIPLALVLSKTLEPRMVPARRRYRFWRTLCQLYSGHLVITCLLTGFWALFLSLSFDSAVDERDVMMIFAPLCVACSVWWWINLGIAVAVRGGTSSPRYVVILLIPVIALAGGLVVLIPLAFLCAVIL